MAVRVLRVVGWLLVLSVVASGLGTSVATAQVPDSTRTASSSSSERPPFDPLPFLAPRGGTALTDSIPTRIAHVGMEDLLAQVPGSFLYDLGTVAWPHGWSLHGLAPHRTTLWLDGRPYTDPFTGRPLYNLLPTSLLNRPRLSSDLGGRAAGVYATWRDYPTRVPITDIRFRRDSNGLQGVQVGHSQKRKLSLLGRPGELQVTIGYGGRATGGAYEGSDLRRERRMLGRVRYRTNQWAVEISDVSARHRIGAQGGVVPPVPNVFSSVYVLPLAETSVLNGDARRVVYRNDLTARLRAPLVPGLPQPMEVSGTWTSHTSAFRPDTERPDTLWSMKANGFHLTADQPLTLGPHHLTLSGRASLWRPPTGNVRALTGSRRQMHVQVRDSLQVAGTALVLDAGWHETSIQRYPSASAAASRSLGRWTLNLHASAAGQPVPWMLEQGFETFVRPLAGGVPGPDDLVLQARAGVDVDLGTMDARVEAFAHEIQGPVELYGVSFGDAPPAEVPDRVQALRASSSFRRAGATVSLGLRRNARRGLYATGHVTAQQFLNADASTLHTRTAETLPALFGRVRLGARFVLFQDLITDLYVEGRGWSAMNSRWFHPPTGLTAVPLATRPVPQRPGTRIGPDGTLNATAEANFYGAKLFFTFENVQARTELQQGTFIVPVYPLPARQFRFGVWWPIPF